MAKTVQNNVDRLRAIVKRIDHGKYWRGPGVPSPNPAAADVLWLKNYIEAVFGPEPEKKETNAMTDAMIKCRFLALTEKAPAEDGMLFAERMLTICERISAMKYANPLVQPELTITQAMCNSDAAWLADYMLRLLAKEAVDAGQSVPAEPEALGN